MILNALQEPDFEQISGYINPQVRNLWLEFNHFITEKYGAKHKITYSKCSGKPGWNVKYQKSGKSICTLYPEKECFIALVVVTLDLIPIIEAVSSQLEESVLNTIRSAKPFNGTLWLMIRVDNKAVLENVKQILLLKHGTTKQIRKA